jgi:hypothetical protein
VPIRRVAGKATVPRFLLLGDVAELFRVHVATVRRWAHDPNHPLTATRPPGTQKLLFDEAHVLELLGRPLDDTPAGAR